jgi:hypothetical protein
MREHACVRRAGVPLLLCLLLTGASAIEAASIQVTNTNDSGAGSLRQAIADSAPGGNITFNASVQGKTITIASVLKIEASVHIDGGAGVTISANGASPVFNVSDTASAVVLRRLTIRDGRVIGENGGGIQNFGELTVQECTIADNYASGLGDGTGHGGGIASTGALTIERSLIRSNFSGANGGGLRSTDTLTVTDTTIHGNHGFYGAGLIVDGGTATLLHVTVTENVGTQSGGGIRRTAGTLSVGNSILANNPSLLNSSDCSGSIVSLDYNLVKNSGCTFSGATMHHLTGVDPKLGSLQWNGGPTRTHAPMPGSPVLDAVPSASCGSSSDQRGMSRPQDSDNAGVAACEMGAFESPAPIVVNSLLDPTAPGKCTLRDAIIAATTNLVVVGCAPGYQTTLPDRITFSADLKGTIALLSSLLVNAPLSIDGPGADRIAVSGGGATNVIFFSSGASSSTYVLSGLTIKDGVADYGGGVDFFGATNDMLAIDRVFFENNDANVEAGSLYAGDVRAVDVSRSTFVNNRALAGTSGLTFQNTVARLIRSTVAETGATAAVRASSSGGAGSADFLMAGCTLKGSESIGLHVAEISGAPVQSLHANWGNSIFQGHAQNVTVQGFPVAFSHGYNVASSTANFVASDSTSANALLGVLTYHGGPVKTFNLKPGSPAIDKIQHNSAGAPMRSFVLDQRGFGINGNYFDSGADERIAPGDVNLDGAITVIDVFGLINFLFAAAPPPAGEGDVNGDGDVTVTDAFYLINRLFAGGPAPL